MVFPPVEVGWLSLCEQPWVDMASVAKARRMREVRFMVGFPVPLSDLAG
jgi:hypothetical protein